MDKPKLNYRFHNPNTNDAFAQVLLEICIAASGKKVEEAIQKSLDEETIKRVIAVPKAACIADLNGRTLLKMPQGKYEGMSYEIESKYIREAGKELVLELPTDKTIELKGRPGTMEINLDEFIKNVAGKGRKNYSIELMCPSELIAKRKSVHNQKHIEFHK